MLAQMLTIGLIVLFGAMLPGPDFAIVVKNTVLHSRRSGIFTSLGIASAALIHVSYCIMGLAIVISESILLFNIIKTVGAVYLLYLGITTLLSKSSANEPSLEKGKRTRKPLSDWVAFRQGFVCNLFNPKATVFFLALFTMVIKPDTPKSLEIFYAPEIFMIIVAWFCSLTIILSHPLILKTLQRIEQYISKVLGMLLIGFGAALAMTGNRH